MVVVVALAYAIFNEAAFVPFVVFGLIGSSVVWISRHRSNKRKKSEAL
jgi:F0F1-type ATP synthase assembly protein I